MATILDLGLLQTFDIVFPFILVWALVYAIFQKMRVVTSVPGINATIATAVAFMVILSTTLVDMINFMVPWFVIAIIFFLLLILIFQMFGIKEADFAKAAKDKAMRWALIGVGLVILLAALGNVLGQQFTDQAFEEGDDVVVEDGTGGTATQSFEGNVTGIFSNSKVLGMVILFAIAIFAIAFLTA
jgi:hypothetical protein